MLLARLPDFWLKYKITLNEIMLGDFSLDIAWRYYLAIMAASRYDCHMLIGLLEWKFIENYGNKEWISEGLSKASSKLKSLAKLNALLAHKPWDITYHHITVTSHKFVIFP